MKNEKLSSSRCGDEEVQEMTAISSLFEQPMLLIGPAFQSPIIVSKTPVHPD